LKKDLLYKFIFVLTVVVVALGLVYFALKETVPELIPLLEHGDVDSIQAYLKESSTFMGIFCTILLQMVQVWSLFIAGMPIQVAAGCVFGFLEAFIICHLSSVLAQMIALTVWRKMGKRLEKWMPINTNDTSRFQEFLNSAAPPAYNVILACMIPVMPNGLIALFAAREDITLKQYTISVWAGSLINVLLCCAVGNKIILGDWLIAGIFVAILVTLFLSLWFFRAKILAIFLRVREKLDAKREAVFGKV